MQRLGYTRSSSRPTHLLQAADTFVCTPMPGMERGTAIIHAAPAMGAGFLQYSAGLDPKGCLASTALQRFIYVVAGDIEVHVRGKRHGLSEGGYAYLPQGLKHSAVAVSDATLTVIEKPYEALGGVPAPVGIFSSEDRIAEQPLMGDDGVRVRSLLPCEPAFDFAVNTMTYDPGAALAMVEVHVMEHGLLMLEGGGIYRLGDDWYPVVAGDFIWMAPFCPQWFGALGKAPAKYLIYKDWNRVPAFGRAGP